MDITYVMSYEHIPWEMGIRFLKLEILGEIILFASPVTNLIRNDWSWDNLLKCVVLMNVRYPGEFHKWSISNEISSSISSNHSFLSRPHVSKSEPTSIEYETLVEEVENQKKKIEILEIDLQAKDSEIKELLDGILQVHNENNNYKVSYSDIKYHCFLNLF